MKNIILSLAALFFAASAVAQVTGSWIGTLEVDKSNRLTLGININGNAATLDSPDQDAYGLPLLVNANIGDSISLSMPQIKMTFCGRLVKGKLTGTFTQGALSMPLTLKPNNAPRAAGNKRPQTPRAPFPYSQTEVTFANPDDGASLAGTLTLPDNPAQGNPVVLMISGSGTQDRDETILDHKPFAVIADALARRGIASLRYDDRGAGKSKGPLNNITTATNTADARAGLQWLRLNHPDSRVGVLGHSEGARIAFALPADFIVALGAPALRGDTILAEQNNALLLASGTGLQTAESYSQALLKVLNGVSVENATINWEPSVVNQSLIENLYRVASNRNPWLDYFIKDDPTADIRALSVPALVLYGGRDCQVTPELNAPRMRALAPGADVRILPELNHLLQHCQTGSPTEYGKIEETIAPEALTAITNFILALPVPRK